MKKIPLILLGALLLRPTGSAAQYQPDWKSLDQRPVPKWFLDAKFGIFIHWGVYSVPAWSPVGSYAEWYQHALVEKSYNGAVVDYHNKRFGPNTTYYQLAGQFKAELFQPDQWAELFRKSGARYVVLTSKHHDGFCLWPSPEADRDFGFPWNASEVGPRQDLIAELFQAIRKTPVHPGLYYSLYEWYDPLYLKDKEKYVTTHAIPQMKELINNYRPDLLWTDGDWDLPPEAWHSQQFLAWLYNESPVKNSIVTYDRWGSGVHFHHGGVYTPEYQPDQDFNGHPFEESQGMGYSYGYNRGEDAWDYNTAQGLVLELADLVSRGGNFLLDIGPDSHGKIPPLMEERLLQIGDWLSVNGEAIYGTRTWRANCQWSAGKRDYKPKAHDEPIILKQTVDPDPGFAVKEIFFTWKPDTLYAILPAYPQDRHFIIRGLHLPDRVKATFLATGQILSWENRGNDVEVRLPEIGPGQIQAPYAFVVRLSGVPGFTPKPDIQVSYASPVASPRVSFGNLLPGTSVYYTLDGSGPTLRSLRYSGPFSISRSATLQAIAQSGDLQPSGVVVQAVTRLEWLEPVRVSHPLPGIRYKAFEPEQFSLEATDTATPVQTGIVPVISIARKPRAEKFCMSFGGYVRVAKTGIYRFSTISDDGSDLWIDGIRIVDNDGDHGNQRASGEAALKGGFHRIRVRYFDSGGDNSLEVQVQTEPGSEYPIPASRLFH